MPITLRDYQKEAVDAVWAAFAREPRTLTVLPTATGKTVIFTELLSRFLPASTGRAVVLMNKVDLVRQTFNRLSANGISQLDLGAYCATLGERDTQTRIIVASIQSVWGIDLDSIELVIVDETHNLSEDEDAAYQKFFARLGPKVKIAAYTATPFRSNGYIYGPGKFFPRVTFRRSLTWMIERGHIVRPVIKKAEHQYDVSKLRVRAGEYAAEDVEKLTNDKKKVKQQVADALPRLAGRRKIVWACSSIAHAEMVREEIQKFEDSAIVHSKLTRELRDSHTKFFETQDHCRHLVFVTIVSEGYDFAPIDAVVLFCPMRSPTRYIQTIGRGLRLSEGKTDCLVLDYGKVVETIGPLDNPSIPGTGRRSKNEEPLETTIKSCPQCLSYVDIKILKCPDCGFDFPESRGLSSQLMVRPNEDGVLLSGGKKKAEPKGYEVVGVMIVKHLSKSSGNLCVKIEYEVKGAYWPICEYFTANPFSWPKGVARLREMEWAGVASDPTKSFSLFDDAIGWIESGGWAVGKKPSKVFVVKDKGWDRVQRIEFGSNGGTVELPGAGDGDGAKNPGLFERC